MSVVGLASDQPEKMFKKSLHRRKDSGDLDVFEAAKYFSGANEIYGYNAASNFAQRIGKDQDRPVGRLSLDMPMRNAIISTQTLVMDHQKQITKEKKHKQPSSPGGRLASFLNSLFNQTSSKKKKSKSTSSQSMKDEDESPGGGGWRRKRRSSISHFRSTTTSQADAKSLYSSSSSGFRTPPPYAQTPTKSYKDLRGYSDHQHAMALISKPNGYVGRKTNNVDSDYAWLDEKLSFIGEQRESYKQGNNGFPEKIQSKCWLSEEKEFKKFNLVDDDGAESDSSSDLFELPNYDLGCFSNGLPVYETTNMDSIKRTTAISTATR